MSDIVDRVCPICLQSSSACECVDEITRLRAKVAALEYVRTVLKRECEALRAERDALQARVDAAVLSEEYLEALDALWKARGGNDDPLYQRFARFAELIPTAPVPVAVPDGFALTKLKPDESTCEQCGRAVVEGPCNGWIAKCGRRVARRDDLGFTDCDAATPPAQAKQPEEPK